MRKIPALALAVALLASGRAALAMGPFGPPTPVLSQDQRNSLEAGYFLYQASWEPSGSGQNRNRAFETRGLGPMDVEQAHAYLQATMLATDYGEWFLRAGGADFKETTGVGSFESGARPFVGTGFRGTIAGFPKIGVFVGAIVQGSVYTTYSDRRRISAAPDAEASADVHSYFDLGLGVAAAKTFGDRVTVYGGPCAVYTQADGHLSAPLLQVDIKSQFRDRNYFGVFAGTRVNLAWGLGVDAEVQARGKASYGLKLSYAF